MNNVSVTTPRSNTASAAWPKTIRPCCEEGRHLLAGCDERGLAQGRQRDDRHENQDYAGESGQACDSCQRGPRIWRQHGLQYGPATYLCERMAGMPWTAFSEPITSNASPR